MLTCVEISSKIAETFAASNVMVTCFASVLLRAASCCSMRVSSAVMSTVEAADSEEELPDVDEGEEDPDADSRATTDSATEATASTKAARARPFHSRVAACGDTAAPFGCEPLGRPTAGGTMHV
jgi:hypothetical protein